MEERFNTTIEHSTGDTTWGISTTDRTIKTRLRKLRAKYPEQVKILWNEPDDPLIAYFPYTWLVIKPPRKLPAYVVEELELRGIFL